MHFSDEKELTVDGLAIGYQAEKAGTLRPGLVVQTINGIATPGVPQDEVMTALRQRPLCVKFEEPKPERAATMDVDSVEIEVDAANTQSSSEALVHRRSKRRLATVRPAPPPKPRSDCSPVPDFPAKEIDPSLTEPLDVVMEWVRPDRGGEQHSDFTAKEWEDRFLGFLSELRVDGPVPWTQTNKSKQKRLPLSLEAKQEAANVQSLPSIVADKTAEAAPVQTTEAASVPEDNLSSQEVQLLHEAPESTLETVSQSKDSAQMNVMSSRGDSADSRSTVNAQGQERPPTAGMGQPIQMNGGVSTEDTDPLAEFLNTASESSVQYTDNLDSWIEQQFGIMRDTSQSARDRSDTVGSHQSKHDAELYVGLETPDPVAHLSAEPSPEESDDSDRRSENDVANAEPSPETKDGGDCKSGNDAANKVGAATSSSVETVLHEQQPATMAAEQTESGLGAASSSKKQRAELLLGSLVENHCSASMVIVSDNSNENASDGAAAARMDAADLSTTMDAQSELHAKVSVIEDDEPAKIVVNEAMEMLDSASKDVEIILRIPQKPEQESELCSGCGNKIRGRLRGAGRYCEYYGTYFCQSCHRNDKAIIPARLVQEWDKKKYKVSRKARQFLNEVMDRPIIDLAGANPAIYASVQPLQVIHGMRLQLNLMKNYIYSCRHRDRLLAVLGDQRYYMEHLELFTLRDLMQVALRGNDISSMLCKVLYTFIKHITEECPTCQGRGFVCELCADDKRKTASLIYPFQVKDTEQCQSCRAYFHTRCHEKMLASNEICPKCARIARIRNKGKS
eukprot:SAG31_NODE_2659_length_5284_cov_6.942152_3_plen_794_part_00